MNKDEFNQWFVGFSDGESSFSITEDNRGKNIRFNFRFIIGLHIDDRHLLEFINTELGCGSIINNKDNTACYFTVADVSQINNVLIPIFDSFSLNTTKYLDYLSFKQALSINTLIRSTSNLEIRENYRKQILDLKESINTKRTEFVLPLNHIKITPYWLLGLIEGEGSFHLRRTSLTPVFSISLTKVQEPVIEKIVAFLTDNLDKYSRFKAINTKVFNLRTEKAKGNSKAQVKLAIFQIDYLFNIFIPFLETLNFQSKKKIKLITTLIYQGKHLKPEIKKFILEVSYTMNNFRLTTFNNLSKYLNTQPMDEGDNLRETSLYPLANDASEAVARVDTLGLLAFPKGQSATSYSQLKTYAAEQERYLNLPPVYVKTNDGRIINIETGDLVRDTFVVEVIKIDGTISLFSTVTECALFFNISRSIIYNKLANGGSIESLNITKFKKIRVFDII